DGPMLMVEQAAVLTTDPEVARDAARKHMQVYLTLPNYVSNLRRLGWGDDDLADGGSDALVDALAAWGDVDAIAARVAEHREAGAGPGARGRRTGRRRGTRCGAARGPGYT